MSHIIQESLFFQLTALLMLAGVIGFAALKLRQPLIVAFIIVGLLAGPDVLHVVQAGDKTVETLAGLGVTLLLFMVGLKLDIGLIKTLGPVALAAGVAQVGITAIAGAILCLALGFEFMTAALVGVTLSFSSTIVVVKLLSDKRDIDSLYGKLSLGILIVQDIAVIVCMVALATFSGPDAAQMSGVPDIMGIAGKILLLAAVTGGFMLYVATPLSHALSRSPELLVIMAVGIAATAAAGCEQAGLSRELGGLLAGVAFASTPYHNIIAARLSGLRDFMMLFFFVVLGLHMSLDGMGSHIVPALTLLLFVLAGKPLIIMIILGALGYRRRTSFMTGVTLGQISEFSLIFMAMAVSAGLADRSLIGLASLIALASIGVSTYAIVSTGRLYPLVEGRLSLLERKNNLRETEQADTSREVSTESCDVIIFGLGRYGYAMAQRFMSKGIRVLGVDFDPQAVRHATKGGIPAVYGDAADPDMPGSLPLAQAKIVVFAFHHHLTGPALIDLRHTLAEILRGQGYRGKIAATSNNAAHDAPLTRYGIDIILTPFTDAACHGADYIMDTITLSKG